MNTGMDFGPNGYFFYILDVNGVLLAHPNREGESLWDEQDERGRYFIREVIQRAQEGGGLTTYDWPLPQNPNRIEQKVVYSVLEPDWGWVVAVGAYTKEINRYANLLVNVLVLTLGIVILLGGVGAYFYANRVSQVIRQLVRQMEAVAGGDLTLPELSISSRDELGDLTRHVNEMVGQLRAMLQQVNHTAAQVAAASEQLLASSEETTQAAEQISEAMNHVVDGSEKQAEHIEQANRVVGEMMERLAHAVHEVEQVQHDSVQSARLAEEGREMMAKSQATDEPHRGDEPADERSHSLVARESGPHR